MGESAAVKKLKEQLDAALLKDRTKEAVELLAKLERLEPQNTRWSHKHGDLQRRLGNNALAIAAYERAVQSYAKSGFLARAIAMAKTITAIDPSRTDVMLSIQQEDAQSIRGKARAAVAVSEAKPILQQAPKLTKAVDEAADEVRFADVEPLADLEIPFIEDAVNSIAPPPATEPALSALESEADRTAERLALLPFFALFSDVPRVALLGLASDSELVEAVPGTIVIRRGDSADAMFGIISGAVTIVAPGFLGEERPRLGEGEVFGEACLLADEPRHADVIVDEQLTALRIPKATLDRLVAKHEEVGNVLLNLLTVRLLGNLMRTSPLFSALDSDGQREAVRLFEVRMATSGTSLQLAGKRGDGLYIPLTGKLEVTSPSGLKLLRPAGTIVGQATLLGRAPSPYTVVTVGDSVLLRLPSTSFMDLVTEYPMILDRLSSVQVDEL